MQSGLGCLLFIFKIQGQNLVTHLGYFYSLPSHILRLKKKKLPMLSLLYKVSLVRA